MFLVLFTAIFAFFSSTMLMTMHVVSVKQKQELSITGDRIGTTYAGDGVNTSFRGGITSVKMHRVDKENVTKVLIRTCEHLYVKAKQNNCLNPRDPATVWGFAGIVNNQGDLDQAWLGATTNTFTCASIDDFGRGLIQEAIPSASVIGRGYRYDFTGMNGVGRTDPCGYTEIVDIQ